jgi:hypothetical protein
MKAAIDNRIGQSTTPVCLTDPGRVSEEIPIQEEQDKIKAGKTSSLFEVRRSKWITFLEVNFIIVEKKFIKLRLRVLANNKRRMKPKVVYELNF